MKYSKNIGIALLTIIFVLTGCSGTPSEVGVQQTHDRSLYDLTKPSTITVTASGFQLLLFIPISINSRFERAYQSIERQANGGLIGDVKVKESWSYAFVGTIYKTTLEATVYPKK